MVQLIVAYVVTMVVFFAIDFVWLGFVARGFYRSQLGPLLLDEFKVSYAAVFYIFYGVGVVVFAVAPGLAAENSFKALMLGALLGFIAYGTYDFTNLATLKGYSLLVAIVDVAWGTFLTGISAWAGAYLTRLTGL